MLVMHAHQKPVLPSKRIDKVLHPALEALVMQCLEKNPNKRPQTARELSDALGALQFDLPWTDERAALWWRQNRPEHLRATSALDEKERAELRSIEPVTDPPPVVGTAPTAAPAAAVDAAPEPAPSEPAAPGSSDA
jgi:serine/threonine protein kinase